MLSMSYFLTHENNPTLVELCIPINIAWDYHDDSSPFKLLSSLVTLDSPCLESCLMSLISICHTQPFYYILLIIIDLTKLLSSQSHINQIAIILLLVLQHYRTRSHSSWKKKYLYIYQNMLQCHPEILYSHYVYTKGNHSPTLTNMAKLSLSIYISTYPYIDMSLSIYVSLYMSLSLNMSLSI